MKLPHRFGASSGAMTSGTCLCLITFLFFTGSLVEAGLSDLQAGETEARKLPVEESEEPKPPVLVEEIVVTATRVSTPRSEVGSSIAVLTAEWMARRQDLQLLDALRTVPALQLRTSGAAGAQTSIFMRGTNAGHTLLRVDGMKFHDPSSPAAAALVEHLMVDGVGRVEVLRGPQSTLYGSDAVGGVINVVSARGEGPPAHRGSIEGGSLGTVLGRVQSRGAVDRFSYAMSFSHLTTDGIVVTEAASQTNAYRNSGFAGRFGFDLTDAFGLDLFTRATRADIEFDGGADPDLSATDHRQYGFRVEPYLLLVEGRWETRLGVGRTHVDRRNRGENTPFFAQFPSRSMGGIRQIEWQNRLGLLERHTIAFGVDYERPDARFERPNVPALETKTETVGVYVQDQLRLDDRLFVTLGFRVDRHRRFGSKATYRAATAYRLSESTILRSSVGTGFKAPTLAQLFDTAFGSNNPDLKPERSVGFDVGIEHLFFDDPLQVSATYFRNEIKDMIVNVFAGPGFQNTNIEEARTQGLELALGGPLSANLVARIGYAYTHTEARRAASFGISDGSRLLRRPPHNLAFDVTRFLLNGRADATLSLLYVGERDDLHPVTFHTVRAGAYTLVNLSGEFRARDGVALFARVENLTNQDYQDVLGFNTPGIGFFGGLRFGF